VDVARHLRLVLAALARRAAARVRAPLAPADPLPGLDRGGAVPALDRTGAIVVVPTYCEAEALPRFVARFEATGLELLVVDDASPDGTGDLADALAADRPWMHVLHRDAKDGLGMAYRAGFGWSLRRGYRVIGQMDADLSHPPEKLGEMLAVIDERDADLVLANRYMPGGGTAGWSRARRILSRLGCTGSKLVLGLPFDDLSGGFKLWRATTLAELDLDAMLSTGYAFQVETTQLAYLMGKRIEEVPFVFSERVAGESKMSLAVSLEGIRVTLALRRRNPRRTISD
jgi:dolichol-phosphate mannosyltransferase